jgi:exoribonuclease II
VKKKHFILIIQNNNKNKKHIKIKKNKKVKSFYKKLKPGDFTVAEGHRHPLV